jgi:hypothetical protein
MKHRFSNTPLKLVILILLVVWVPLVLFSMMDNTLYSGVHLPFLYDVAMQFRILIALPLLVLLKKHVFNKLASSTEHICTTLLNQEELQSMIDTTFPTVRKLANSSLTEVLILLLVVASTVSMVRGGVYTSLGGENTTWMTLLNDSELSLSRAGRWSVFVTIPVIQFFIASWIWRYFV